MEFRSKPYITGLTKLTKNVFARSILKHSGKDVLW